MNANASGSCIGLGVVLFLLPNIAQAYIGPGMAGGAVAVAIGIVMAICLAFLGIIFYPLKRLFKKRVKKRDE